MQRVAEMIIHSAHNALFVSFKPIDQKKTKKCLSSHDYVCVIGHNLLNNNCKFQFYEQNRNEFENKILILKVLSYLFVLLSL